MMPSFLKRYLTVNYQYDNAVEQQRAQLLFALASLFVAISLLWLLTITLPEVFSGVVVAVQITSPLVLLLSIVIRRLIQRGNLTEASYLLLAMVSLAVLVPLINEINTPAVISLIVPIILASVLVDRRVLMGLTVICVLMIVRAWLNTETGLDTSMALGTSLVVILSAVILGLFTYSLSNITDTAARIVLNTRRLTEKSAQSEADTSIASVITDSITHLRNDLGYSYVRVLLLDDQHEIITTYYSSIGVEQVGQTSAFSFTQNSAFQKALNTLEPQLIRPTDMANLSVHLLPASTSGIILPAHSINRTIALFDIQTESEQLIESEDISILSLYIAQIATNLVYLQTVNTLRDDIHEQQALIDNQRQQLLRIQNLQTEGIRTDWESYLNQRGINAIGYNIDNARKLSNLHTGNIPDQIKSAMESDEVIVQLREDDQHITIPIRLRDTILGAMSFTVPNEIPITDRKIEFIRNVTERLALALDNKRLIEQTQTQAQREATANEIGSVLLRSTDVETVLQTAAERFNEALGAITTQIYLQPTALQSTERPQREDPV